MKKNKLLALFFISLFSIAIKAQVGINTTTPSSSLDIVAKNATGISSNVDGILIPRVDRERAQNMTSIPISTLIYINSISTGTQIGITANVDAVGFYYFNGTEWIKVIDSDLRLVGTKNHITKDAGIGGAGTNAGFGASNIAIGTNSLRNNTTASRNVGVGENSLFSATAGNNVAMGTNSGSAITSGQTNVAMGDTALVGTTTGNGNTAIGYNSLVTNTSGNNNTALGNNAGVSSGALTNATAIGYNSKVNQSNSLILGGTGADAVNVGIGTPTPATQLHTTGTVRFAGIGTNTVDTKVLTADVSGNITTRATTALLPQIMGGGDGTDVVTSTTTISASSGSNTSAVLLTRTFTLTQKSAVTFSYNLSVGAISTAAGGNISDGRPKYVGTQLKWSAVPGGSPFTVGAVLQENSFPFTAGATGGAFGYFSNGSSRTVILDPGTYSVDLVAAVFAQDATGVRATYGGNSSDQFDVVATPVQ